MNDEPTTSPLELTDGDGGAPAAEVGIVSPAERSAFTRTSEELQRHRPASAVGAMRPKP